MNVSLVTYFTINPVINFFKVFFLMWAILKAFIKVVKILFQLHILVFWAERHVGS